ncbi:GNAT family N-acetyltransferase [Actinocorallia sp. B10E7]|uniref:GNAT family N-acetyltransferase n=1 Tax=Actinocorallia sp. B10E7 TaxID=3153558 RepID=UPI00325D6B7F
MIETLLAAYDEQLRGAGLLPAGATAEHDGPLLRVVGQQRGFVSGPRDLSGFDVDALIEAQKAYFGARGEAVEWKTRGHDLPVDLPERLSAAGFVPEDTETVMIGRVRDLPREVALPEGVTIRRVDDAASASAIAAMESEVWGTDLSWIADHLMDSMAAAPDRIAIFVAEAEGRIVSAAWMVLREGREFASLWGGSTLAAWRGRGIYRALVATRVLVAEQHSHPYLQVDASDDSRPVLERLGFHAITTTTPYIWTPAP